EQVTEEAARRAGRLPGRQPVALGNARALEHLAIHLEVPLLVGDLEETALLELVEGGVGGRGGDVVRGRQLGVVVVGELIDGALEIARTHRAVGESVGRNARALREVALALSRLERDVALPRQVRGVLEALGVLQGDRPGYARLRGCSVPLQ